jgi:hypothetical protein
LGGFGGLQFQHVGGLGGFGGCHGFPHASNSKLAIASTTKIIRKGLFMNILLSFWKVEFENLPFIYVFVQNPPRGQWFV